MSVEGKAFKGAKWLALFKFISQSFSWITTIIVARLLVPEDYALMEMATVITGYAMAFSELGLGGAIIQRKNPTADELSSIFWFALLVSLILSMACFAFAYPTALIFHEQRVVPLVRAVSILFIVSGLQIVPLNLLKKELDFKTVGRIEMVGTFASCTSMLGIAWMGGGVWTLLGGHIVRDTTKLFLVYARAGWWPRFRFKFKEAKPYLKFGLPLVFGGSLSYVYERSDKFFAARAWSSANLGYYTLARQLAMIPTDKVVSLINQVSYSAFSKLQDNRERFNAFYLNIVKTTAMLVFPIFVGGFLVGDDIVKFLFDEKWYPMIFVFRCLCIVEIMTSLNAVNNFVHGAQGRPKWFLYFNIILATSMPVSFYFGAMHGLKGILVPWFGTYFIVCSAWILITLRKIGIRPFQYFRAILTPTALTLLMSVFVLALSGLGGAYGLKEAPALTQLLIAVPLGGCVYLSGLFFLDRNFIHSIRRLLTA